MQTHTLIKGFFSIFLLCLLVSTAAAAGGSGIAGDPYRIETPAELQAMNNDLDAYYSLQNDIDLTGVTWVEIGNEENPFIGNLIGNNYTLSDLTISTSISNVGLFGILGSGASISHIKIRDFNIYGKNSVGALFGAVIMASGTNTTCIINNVDISDSEISAYDYYSYVGGVGGVSSNYANVDIRYCDMENITVSAIGTESGGLMGIGASTYSKLSIDYCTVKDSIISSDKWIAGGLLGRGAIDNSHVTIDNSLVENSIITAPSSYTGGLMGYGADTNSQLTATNCTVKYNVIITSSNLSGGLFGLGTAHASKLTATNCTVIYCNISSQGSSGGLIGRCNSMLDQININDCTVAFSDIYGVDECGGIIGSAGGIDNINNSSVLYSNISSAGSDFSRSGGIIGSYYINYQQMSPVINNCYIGSCNISSPLTTSDDGYSGGIIGYVGIYVSPFPTEIITNTVIQNSEINGYIADELSNVENNDVITINTIDINVIVNGSYHADLGDQTYLAAVTDTGASYSITITPPDSAAYTISSGAFYTEADYTDIGETWTSHTGSYTYTLPKTSGSSTASAGYLAIYKDGYSDYIYWGLPLFSYPIIITELDVPATINLGESPGISATAYNINTYQWQHSTNGVSWSNVDESWAPTTAGTHYLRLKTANDDFTAYSGTATIQVIPQKAIVTFEAATPTSIALNGDVTFIGSITLIGSDTLTSYTWNFGDGTTDSSTLAPTHTYTSAGTYTVTLTVVTAAGTTISSRTNYITVSAQPEFVKFDNTTYTAGDTATVSWNLLNTNFADHEYTIRIFRLDKLGQAFDALTPVPISSPSGSDTFDTTTWSGNYSVYIYQDSYIFREPTDITTVISIHDLQLLITNSGVTWENYTLLTISDGISTIAEGNTSTGTYTFNLQTGTYTITATTDGKTPISTTIYLSSNDIITFDWVTGASKGTTTGAGSAYASTFITFRVLDAKYGLPISGVTITTQGVAATNPFEWFANLFGTAWGATILGTNQTGITDDSGTITFAMFSGVRYIINIDYPVLDDPITRTFTPSSLATEYPIYLDIADPDTPDVTTSVATAVTANISGQIIASYSDTSLTTTSIRMEIFEKGLDGNYTLLDQISAYGNASTHAFQLNNFQGKNVKIIITGQTGAFGTVERIYYHTFPGPAVTLGNLPASAYIWICLISAILLGGVATYISSYAAAFVIVFVEWIYWFFGWFFEIGAIPAATLLTVATVIAVAAYMASRR